MGQEKIAEMRAKAREEVENKINFCLSKAEITQKRKDRRRGSKEEKRKTSEGEGAYFEFKLCRFCWKNKSSASVRRMKKVNQICEGS